MRRRPARLPWRGVHEPFVASHSMQISRPCAAAAGFESNLLFGGFVVEFDHYPVGIGDEDLPEFATRNLPALERQTFRVEPLLHAIEITTGEGDMVDHAGVRL